jgi:hypothetical protein
MKEISRNVTKMRIVRASWQGEISAEPVECSSAGAAQRKVAEFWQGRRIRQNSVVRGTAEFWQGSRIRQNSVGRGTAEFWRIRLPCAVVLTDQRAVFGTYI